MSNECKPDLVTREYWLRVVRPEAARIYFYICSVNCLRFRVLRVGTEMSNVTITVRICSHLPHEFLPRP